MSYYKARMYSPTLGRFLQTDPIGYGDGMNIYAYVGNDPVNNVDPTGLGCEIAASGGGGPCPDLDLDGITVEAPGISTYAPSSPSPFITYADFIITPDIPSGISVPMGGGKGTSQKNGAADIVVTGTSPKRSPTALPSIILNFGPLTPLLGASLASLAAPYNPKVQYCGAEGGASFPGGTWNKACYTHDVCYGTPGASRAQCDAQLAADIYEQCSASDPGDSICSGAAFIYYWAVRFGGGGPFERAQRGRQ